MVMVKIIGVVKPNDIKDNTIEVECSIYLNYYIYNT